MPVTKKTNHDMRYDTNVAINNEVKSHANDPFVVKKAEEAKSALAKIVLPEVKKK